MVVEADDRNILGHPPAAFAKRSQDAGHEDIRRAKKSREGRTGIDQAARGYKAPFARDQSLSRYEIGVDRKSRLAKRPFVAAQTACQSDVVLDTRDMADPLVAELGEMRRCEITALLVVGDDEVG